MPDDRWLVMYDSIEPALMPSDGDAVAGYVGGAWPTFTNGELARYAHGRRMLSIAVDSALDAEALDIEWGDATAAQAVEWAKRQLARGDRPALYRSVSKVGDLIVELFAAGLDRGDFRIWSAHWNGVAHICTSARCTPGWTGPAWVADGTQWSTCRYFDESSLVPEFFAGLFAPLAPAPTSGSTPRSTIPTRSTLTPKERDMPWLLRTEGEPGVYLVDGGTRSHVDAASLQVLVDRFGPVLVLDTGTVAGIPIAAP